MTPDQLELLRLNDQPADDGGTFPKPPRPGRLTKAQRKALRAADQARRCANLRRDRRHWPAS